MAAIQAALIEAFRPSLKTLPPLSLYVHFPWCVKKCPYCDFNSHEIHDPFPEKQYVAALIQDLERCLPQIWGRKINSIFFGGGTPSLLSAKAVDELLSQFRMLLPIDPFAEITLEANPGTFEVGKYQDFRQAGVNRLSIGIQSFDPRYLQTLGRVHDDKQAKAAVETARSIFDNFNLDLMYALPNQTLVDVERDIEIACEYSPTHISAYHLTIEPNTWFYRYPPELPTHDLSAEMQELVERVLTKCGYTHYETSAFCVPGKQSQHNLNYWQFGDYVGIGAGAHSKISFRDRIVRQARYKQPKEYMAQVSKGNSVQNENEISVKERGFEFMMNALRLMEGFPVRMFEERTGLSLASIQRELAQAEERGLIERDIEIIRPTLRGQRFLNDTLQIFL